MKNNIKNIALSALLALTLASFGGCSSSEAPTDPSNSSNNDNSSNSSLKSNNTDSSGKLSSIDTSNSVKDVIVKDDTLYIAEGNGGIEVVKIGYKDKISSQLISKITSVNAQKIKLSNDGKTLYVKNEQGLINVIDVSDVNNPVLGNIKTGLSLDIKTVSQDGVFEYRPKDENGLEIWNISNPSSPIIKSNYKASSAYGAVLADNDTKVLIAAGISGINILDIQNATSPKYLAHVKTEGSAKGITLNKDEGILFIANEDKGVSIYHLNMLLDNAIK